MVSNYSAGFHDRQADLRCDRLAIRAVDGGRSFLTRADEEDELPIDLYRRQGVFPFFYMNDRLIGRFLGLQVVSFFRHVLSEREG